MTYRERFNIINKIVDRANDLGITIGSRCTQMMDISNADKQFNLRLEEFLNAEQYDFCHDFIGIQRHMDRSLGVCKVVDFFVPRFAGDDESEVEENA